MTQIPQPSQPDQATVTHETALRTVHIQYFALLREQRGLSEETVTTRSVTARTLYEELRQAHRFSLPSERMSVALNNHFVQWDEPLNDNDTVIFIPPVAGG